MKLIPKIKQANRKFYNKWLYKVTFRLEGASVLRMYKLDDIPSVLENPDKLIYRYVRDAASDKEDFFKLIDFMKNAQVPYAKRIESSLIDFYTNDEKFFENLSDLLVHRIYAKHYPVSELADDSDLKIFVKKYPHNKYQYKVFLRPHKFNGDVDSKRQFIKWLDTQDKIRISDTVKDWFIKTDWNWDRRYLLVEDEKTLLFLKMRSPDAVGKIYKYSILDK